MKTTIFLKNFYNFSKMNLIYQKYFLEYCKNYSTRTCLEVSKLPKNVKIKIEAFAIRI
ncbi:Rid family hydrolase [Enterobacteriaceae endosymbiont of Donacia provostii]|uniref:Rid family hydrolase n=1 Tax=Enterobacteriaceae endosymbiont of Donacia provostii TaxID=2675781 RepID=UPI001456A71E|nr:Rid family hydrolase [Enterobacteriaceae endosymbiont of Donacia provostii]